MSSSQTSGAMALDESLSFDEISKLFSLPIAEAANILGVCSSVLKKICRDNGVVRWPYRKFLAGKSVEEIQKDAARERKKELTAARQRNDSSASSVVSSTGAQFQNKMSSSTNTTQANILQQQGNRFFQNGWPNHMLQSGLTKSIPAHLDEFKQGFPSNGLSTASIRWWGSSSPDGSEDEIFEEEPITDQVGKQQSGELADDEVEFVEEEKPERRTDKGDIGPQGTALLSSVRKSAAAEGREALKLGVYRGYGSFKLGRRERVLLHGVFKSSLPSQWRVNCS